jgi:uncharacterized protein YndB with AHSA1/START domain
MIKIKATVNAPIEKVWELWNGVEHIVKWGSASEDWHTTYAESDVRVGGEFSSRMEAKDGSMGFDFAGIYDAVEPHKRLAYTLGDGRKVEVAFEADGGTTKIDQAFEAEDQNPVEMQKAGWQAILDSFKRYAEDKNNWDKMQFVIDIDAPVETVYSKMLAKSTYDEWTTEFNPTSTFKGSWDKGEKIVFVSTDDMEHEDGMVCKVKENIANKFVSLEVLGIMKGSKEIITGEAADKWKGSLENYYYYPNGNGTKLRVVTDVTEEFKDYFEAVWPKALMRLKEICETK